MRTFKITLVITLVALSSIACDTNNSRLPFVRREALESAQAETKEAKNELLAVQESYAKQNEELSSILSELSSLSMKTTSIQLTMEGQRALTQTEQIDIHLNAIKERIDKLEKAASATRKVDSDMAVSAATIKKLRATVANQEQEIALLKQSIAEKDETIRVQKDTISVQNSKITEQSNTISDQQEKIRETLAEQVEMLYQAGLEFEELADDAEESLDVNGRRDRKAIKAFRTGLYETAATFYDKAARQGHSKARARFDQVNDKLDQLI